MSINLARSVACNFANTFEILLLTVLGLRAERFGDLVGLASRDELEDLALAARQLVKCVLRQVCSRRAQIPQHPLGDARAEKSRRCWPPCEWRAGSRPVPYSEQVAARPARMAGNTDMSSSNTVTTRMLTCGLVRWIRRVASMPFTPWHMQVHENHVWLMSRRCQIDGFLAIASLAHDLDLFLRREQARKPLRVIVWSSAIRMRMGSIGSPLFDKLTMK